jgi:hypothetical protein
MRVNLKRMWWEARNTPRRTMSRGFGCVSSLVDDSMTVIEVLTTL